MDEKKTIKISLSTFFLFLAIILIIVMGFFMYKLYNEKTIATQKIEDLNNEINTLEKTVNDFQQKIDSISNTINSSEVSSDNNASNNFENDSHNTTLSLKKGNYTINEVKLDEVGVSNEECGVTLKENNDFQIYMGYGSTHSGKYEIKNNTLICKSNLLEWESGSYGSRPTDVIFKFDIINTNNLKLSDITINDPNSEKLVFPEGLSIGMTYSIK